MNDLDYHLERLERLGYTVIEDVLSPSACDELSTLMDKANASQNQEYGVDRLKELRDYGVVRDLMLKEPAFLELVVHPVSMAFVDKILGSTAILHLQNGIVLEPQTKHEQAKYHRDFAKTFICEEVLSLNTFFLIDEFTAETGGTWVVPFTHTNKVVPSERYLEENKVQIVGRRGSLFIFDSLLIHKAGDNSSPNFRRGLNHQYTRPFIKQQVDYVTMMQGKLDQESKLAQIFGFWTRPPRSIQEYRVDPDKRTYRGGQG
jgi:ectoine hydroxylase-related dioxygenase (phytanoyl-CoA dioxygenase family)